MAEKEQHTPERVSQEQEQHSSEAERIEQIEVQPDQGERTEPADQTTSEQSESLHTDTAVENQAVEEEQAEAESAESEAKRLEELTAQLKAAEEKAEEYYQRYLRAQADFDNFRKRTRREKEEWQTYGALPLIEQLLPVLDNFERAIEAGQTTQDTESLLKGIEMVFKQVKQVLADHGLEEIEAEGKPFDPHLHEAVMQVESDQEPGIVVEAVQKGYRLKDRVIRPSMVKVSQ